MTGQLNRKAAMFAAVGAAMVVLGLLAAIAPGDQRRVTVVRTTRAASAGQYLTGNDIEAVQLDQADVTDRGYVTVDQAQLGLIAAHGLEPGELVDVSDVYSHSADVNLVPPQSATSPPIPDTTWILLIVAGAAIAWFGTRDCRRVRARNHTTCDDATISEMNGDSGIVVSERAKSVHDRRVEPNSSTLIVEDNSTETVGLDPTALAGTDQMQDIIKVDPFRERPASPAPAKDPAAQPVGCQMKSTAVLDDAVTVGDGAAGGHGHDDVMRTLAIGKPTTESAAVVAGLVERPPVMLLVCGREVSVRGRPPQQGTAVLFVLAAAGREVRSSELSELTGYSPKTLSTVFTASHELVKRNSGALRLADHVWTDHAWATRCVTQLAGAMRLDAESADTFVWMLTAFEALQALEQGPFAVLPALRERARPGVSPWGWIDDYPADVAARSAAETEVAEAALALSELWLAAPGTHRVVSAEQMTAEMCRLAAIVPYANVVRQLRPPTWVSGAECLLSAAARLAAGEEALIIRVQQAARDLAARGCLDASNELADELRL